MKILLLTITSSLFPAWQVLAHEEGAEITNLSEADRIGPLVAIVVVVGAIIIARFIRQRSA